VDDGNVGPGLELGEAMLVPPQVAPIEAARPEKLADLF
jgi:hypothetical protein